MQLQLRAEHVDGALAFGKPCILLVLRGRLRSATGAGHGAQAKDHRIEIVLREIVIKGEEFGTSGQFGSAVAQLHAAFKEVCLLQLSIGKRMGGIGL